MLGNLLVALIPHACAARLVVPVSFQCSYHHFLVWQGNSEEEEDEEEDSGDDSQQDEAVGTAAEGNVALLDKPLVVEGKRRKRSVNRLTAGKLVADAVPLEIEAVSSVI